MDGTHVLRRGILVLVCGFSPAKFYYICLFVSLFCLFGYLWYGLDESKDCVTHFFKAMGHTFVCEQFLVYLCVFDISISLFRFNHLGPFFYFYFLNRLRACLVCKRIWNRIWIRFRMKENKVREKINILLKSLI